MKKDIKKYYRLLKYKYLPYVRTTKKEKKKLKPVFAARKRRLCACTYKIEKSPLNFLQTLSSCYVAIL